MAKAVPVALKPGDDGKAWIARFVEAAGKTEKFTIFWAASEPPQLRLTDTSERPLQKLDNVITVPAGVWSPCEHSVNGNLDEQFHKPDFGGH